MTLEGKKLILYAIGLTIMGIILILMDRMTRK